MDAIVLLKEDHKTVNGLFREFEKIKETGSANERRSLVDKILKELTTHAYIEETIFYPAAREAVPETNDHVLESVEEHHVVAWLLSELRHLDADDETFNAKVMVLIENVRHHVEEEEREWFPEVRKAMGRKRLVELGEAMLAAKPEAPSDPLHLQSAQS
jgi:hemerythrin superfamily protein